jgi:hypothetical protein
VIFWRREPRFRKIVRPDQPLEKVYCRVLEHESPDPDSPCRLERGELPRLANMWAIPHRESKLLQAGGGRWFGLIGGTFLLYPSLLRPGSCMDGKGKAGIAYLCAYPHLVEYKDGEYEYSMEGRYFKLRDDVEELGGYQDRFGHPIYIVRNGFGETFRLAGVYARIYHILRERDGWVSGADLQDEEVRLHRRLAERVKEAVDTMSQERLEELSLEYGNTGFDLAGRVSELLTKLDRGEVEELSPPGRVPADIERLFAAIEPKEFFFEFYTLGELAERRKDEFDGDLREAFLHTRDWFTVQALGLLVYEALIIEMGIV